MFYFNKKYWKKWKSETGMGYAVAIDVAQIIFFIEVIKNFYLNGWAIYETFIFDIIVLSFLGLLKFIYFLIGFPEGKIFRKSLKKINARLSPEIKKIMHNYKKVKPLKIFAPIEEKNLKKYKKVYKYYDVFDPLLNKNIKYWKIVSFYPGEDRKNKFVPVYKKK